MHASLLEAPAQGRLLLTALADLVLPGRCAGCAAPMPPLCPACAAALTQPPRLAWPDPTPSGLPPPWAASTYAGPVRTALLAHKERGRASLARPLGDALGASLVAAAQDAHGLLVAVPVPSSRRARRARGEDPLLRLCRHAVAASRREGVSVRLLPALRQHRRVADQAGLSARQRADNLRGAHAVPARLAGPLRGAHVVLLDDVLTTGATLTEAARALRAVGADVVGAGVVAATARGGRTGRAA